MGFCVLGNCLDFKLQFMYWAFDYNSIVNGKTSAKHLFLRVKDHCYQINVTVAYAFCLDNFKHDFSITCDQLVTFFISFFPSGMFSYFVYNSSKFYVFL